MILFPLSRVERNFERRQKEREKKCAVVCVGDLYVLWTLRCTLALCGRLSLGLERERVVSGNMLLSGEFEVADSWEQGAGS